jgi:hypothetical protein
MKLNIATPVQEGEFYLIGIDIDGTPLIQRILESDVDAFHRDPRTHGDQVLAYRFRSTRPSSTGRTARRSGVTSMTRARSFRWRSPRAA